MTNKGFIIAIDGPVAAGKGTIAPALADKLHGFYLYTGATYRCAALYCLENGVDFSNPEAVIDSLREISIDLMANRVILNGKDVTEEIKKADVARKTPAVAAIAEVRRAMVARQQQIAQREIDAGHIIVIEGRDTATVVFPDAALKVFLTAKSEIRAKRRLEQYHAMGREDNSFEEVLADLERRDKEDTERLTDPLVKNPADHDYVIVDNSEMSEEETVRMIVKELEKRGHAA